MTLMQQNKKPHLSLAATLRSNFRTNDQHNTAKATTSANENPHPPPLWGCWLDSTSAPPLTHLKAGKSHFRTREARDCWRRAPTQTRYNHLALAAVKKVLAPRGSLVVGIGLAPSAHVHSITMAAMMTSNPHRLGLLCMAIVSTLTHSGLAPHPDTRNRLATAHSRPCQVRVTLTRPMTLPLLRSVCAASLTA